MQARSQNPRNARRRRISVKNTIPKAPARIINSAFIWLMVFCGDQPGTGAGSEPSARKSRKPSRQLSKGGGLCAANCWVDDLS